MGVTIKLEVWASRKLAILAAGIMVCGAYADGYRNPPPTAEGIGKSGANMVFADDASAVSYNPANLAFQTNASIVVDLTMARTENSYNNPFVPNADSKDSWVPLPNLYFSAPVGDKGIAFGFGITTPYGQGIEWNASEVYNPYSPISLYKAEIAMVDFNPTIAFKLGEKIGVGIGADIYYSELQFDALTGAVPPPVPPGPGSPPTGSAHAEGDDFGVGANVGITWQMTERQRTVFTYRSETELNYKGDLDVTPGPGGSPFVSSSFGLKIKYPTILSAGYGIALTDTIRVEADVEWLNWSVNKTQTANLGANGSLAIPQNWDDTFTFAVGGDWRFAEGWTIRAGYAFIESPIPDSTISPILPDADRHALSLGLGYAVKGHSIDVAYTFSIYEDRSSTTSAYPGTYDIDSNLVGLTYSYSF